MFHRRLPGPFDPAGVDRDQFVLDGGGQDGAEQGVGGRLLGGCLGVAHVPRVDGGFGDVLELQVAEGRVDLRFQQPPVVGLGAGLQRLALLVGAGLQPLVGVGLEVDLLGLLLEFLLAFDLEAVAG